MDRRKFIETGIGLGALAIAEGALGRGFAQGGIGGSLKAAGAGCGINVGACVNRSKLQSLPGFQQFFIANFNLLTPEGEMKFGPIHPQPTQYNFTDADWLVGFCQSNRIGVHGHNLCANSGNPDWLKSTLTPGNAEQILVQHIQTVAGRYAGKIDSWDVVNEPIGVWFNRPDGLYDGPWTQALGPRYLDIAFHATADTDPAAQRVLNVHHVEHADKDSDRARAATLNLVEAMLKRGVPIQAVGIESHIAAGKPWDPRVTGTFINNMRQLGVQILITELDVLDSQVQGDIATRDKAVADFYANYLTTVIPAGHVQKVIFWSPTDKNNWMEYMKSNPLFTRNDNDQTHRPGLLDVSGNPKAAYSAVSWALQNGCHR